jgi:MSHA biogenesis protein MshP
MRVNAAKSRQNGFAAIAAIFLVVVLAALGGFMVTFSNTQQLTSAQDVQGTRAYWAARAGLDWSIASAASLSYIGPGSCPFDSSKQLIATAPAAVDGFILSACFSKDVYTEGGDTPTIYRFTVVANSTGNVGAIGYVERSVSAMLEHKL